MEELERETAKLRALTFLRNLLERLEAYVERPDSEKLKKVIRRRIEDLKKGNFKYLRLMPGDRIKAGNLTVYNDYFGRVVVSYYHDNKLKWESSRPFRGGVHVIAQIGGNAVYFPLDEKGNLKGIRPLGKGKDLPDFDVLGLILPHSEEGHVAVVHFGHAEHSYKDLAAYYLSLARRHLPQDQLEEKLKMVTEGNFEAYEVEPGTSFHPVEHIEEKIENKEGELYLNNIPLGEYGAVIGRNKEGAFVIPIRKGVNTFAGGEPLKLTGAEYTVSRVHGVILPHPEKEKHFIYIHLGRNKPKFMRPRGRA